MTDTDLLDALRTASERLAEAEEEATRLRAERDAEIRRLLSYGVRYRLLEDATGLSRFGLDRIRKEGL